MNIEDKLKKLNNILKGFGKCAVAFSGGVDSTFLLAAAIRVLGKDSVRAITVVPPYVARWEIEEARMLAVEMDVSHIIIESEMIEEVKMNPADRCYICKTALFRTMKNSASNLGIEHLCDGSNADDLGDYRPGMRALKELGIQSPLLQAGLTKQDIRDLSKKWNVSTWDKPPYACLLTRVPHQTEIGPTLLDRIEKSELVMIKAGFPYVRVRHHGDMARIEIPRDRFEEFITGNFYNEVCDKLKGFGYRFVTLDLGGYKMGNMNQKGMKNG